jgi:hypothetical protein
MLRSTILLIAMVFHHLAAQAAPSYRCVLLDGSTQDVSQNLATQFTATFKGCEPLPERLPENIAPPPRSEDHGLRIVQKPDKASAGGERGPGLTLVVRNSAPPAKDDFTPLIKEVSRRHSLDPDLIDAIIGVESGHQPDARSPKGALGLMQVMPATGARYGVRTPADLLRPAINIEAGVRYLADLQRAFPGRVDLMLAAYNAGEGAVTRHGNRIPPYRETIDYVHKILSRYANRTPGRVSMD